MTIETIRTPDERFADIPGWPYAPNYINDLAGYEGMRLHYVDEGPRDGTTILCLHGEPTWSYLYRKMAPVFLAAGHRFVAPDLYGFGRSDKPTDDEVYTYHFHRNALLVFVERLNLQNVCLVVQDWGGLLGLTLPMEAPERYTHLIVMNTFLPAGEDGGKGFEQWRDYNRANPDLDVAGLLQRSTPILDDDEAAAYDAPFPDASYKAGVRRFPELVMVKDTSGEVAPAAQEGIETSLAAREFWRNDWQGESFMAIGMQDPVLGPPAMQALHGMIRNCPPPMEVADAGHFVQEWGEPVASAALDSFGLR